MVRQHRLTPILALALCAALTAQRDVRPITASAEHHTDAKISPDGALVAFRVPGKIAMIGFSGGAESPLVIASNLGDYLWAPTSSGLYYLESNVLKYIARTGGNSRTIQTLTGQAHRLWCVTSNDALVYGSRFNPTAGTYSIFRVATNGLSAPVDIVTSLLTVDGVRLSPNNAKMTYREYFATPFSNREIWLANADGGNPVSMTGGPIPGQPDNAEFIDAGTTVLFTTIAPTSPLPQLARLTSGVTTMNLISDIPGLKRRSTVAPDQIWVAHEAYVPPAGGSNLAIMPTIGGGYVLFDPAKTFSFDANPTVDAGSTRMAFSGIDTAVGGFKQVHVADFDRELRLFPKLEIGNSFSIVMPATNGDIGAIFISAGLSGTLITIGGLVYGFALDATALSVVGGVAAGGSIGTTLIIPNSPVFQGQTLYWQGVRANPGTLLGDFTRYALTRIF